MATLKPSNLIYSKTLEEFFHQSPSRLIEQQIKKDMRIAQGKIKSENASLYQLSNTEEKVFLDKMFNGLFELLNTATTRKAFTEIVKQYQQNLVEAFNSKGITFPAVINKKVVEASDLGKFLSDFIAIFPKAKTDEILNSVIENRKQTIFAADGTLDFVSNFARGSKNVFDLKKHFKPNLPSNIRIRKYDPLFVANNGFTKNIKLPDASFKQSPTREYALGYATYKANDILFASYGGDFTLYGSSFDLTFFSQDVKIPTLVVKEQRSSREFTVEVVTIDACSKVLPHAKGNVLIYGLGVGYSAYELSNLDSVDTVTIIESDPYIVEFFSKFVYEQLPNKEKINIIISDYYEHMTAENIKQFDTTYVDGSLLINSPTQATENIYNHYLGLEIDEKKDNVFIAFENSILSTYRTLLIATLAGVKGTDKRLKSFNLTTDALLSYFDKNKVNYLVDFDAAFSEFDLSAIRKVLQMSKVTN